VRTIEEQGLAGDDSHAPVALSRIGSYLLGRVVGRGKVGITYEAVHVAQGRRVAVKLLDRAAEAGPVSRQDALFAREAMILAKLPRHPGVIGVLDAGLADGLPYIVTEFVEGRPLSEWIRLRRSDLRSGVRILRDVALAVHHAHVNGILHRNLKPSNVLVDESGRTYVTDFGSAKRLGPDHSQSSMLFRGGVVGSPSYMSPEQAASLKTVGVGTDVYSLGAILYEMLTGRPPFEGGLTVADLVQVIRGAIVPPSSGDKRIDDLCMKALAKTSDQRHPSASAFADALTEWLGEAPVAPAGRKSWLWAAVAAGVATVAAILHLVRGH
jgi:serine/threonine-protein kinase